MTGIRRLRAEDAPACDAIIASLPYFFGDPAGVVNAAQDVRRYEGRVTEDEGQVTGFLTLEQVTGEAAEISWLAIHPDFRREGRGRMLVDHVVSEARSRGARMLFLFTSAEDDPPEVEDGYEGTRRFYPELGFVRLWVGRQSGWSEDHLLMARALE